MFSINKVNFSTTLQTLEEGKQVLNLLNNSEEPEIEVTDYLKELPKHFLIPILRIITLRAVFNNVLTQEENFYKELKGLLSENPGIDIAFYDETNFRLNMMNHFKTCATELHQVWCLISPHITSGWNERVLQNLNKEVRDILLGYISTMDTSGTVVKNIRNDCGLAKEMSMFNLAFDEIKSSQYFNKNFKYLSVDDVKQFFDNKLKHETVFMDLTNRPFVPMVFNLAHNTNNKDILEKMSEMFEVPRDDISFKNTCGILHFPDIALSLNSVKIKELLPYGLLQSSYRLSSYYTHVEPTKILE